MGIDNASPEEWENAYNKLSIKDKKKPIAWDRAFNEGPPKEWDAVERPEHYNNGNIEAIDYIRQQLGSVGIIDYYEGSVLKYLHRWKYKNNEAQDLKKARWYLARLITEIEDD